MREILKSLNIEIGSTLTDQLIFSFGFVKKTRTN